MTEIWLSVTENRYSVTAGSVPMMESWLSVTESRYSDTAGALRTGPYRGCYSVLFSGGMS
jgi:hypothetical protein